jgi:DNA polymerase III delta subunit
MTHPVATAPIGYYGGDDGYSIDRAADALGRRVAAETGDDRPLERWRTGGDRTSAAEIAERAATGVLFGGGTLAVVDAPGPLLRSKADREALFAVLGVVAPGNALAFTAITDGSSGRPSAALEALREAVAAAGGEAREFRAPTAGGMARWIEERATERGMTLAPGAAKALAERVGAFVREGDVDRSGQGRLAVAELAKLALYRPGGAVTADDVAALVAEAVPASTWAMLDAVAMRGVGSAASLLERVLDATPEPVVLVQLHRRIRELLEVADRRERGETPGSLVRTMKLKPFRAETLARQAASWTPGELEDALGGLLELDATIKGAAGIASGESQRRLAFTMWLAESVAPR